MDSPASPSSPVEFPLAGAFFVPTGLSGAPLLRALESLAASLLSAPRPPSQRRNLAALDRRLALLCALLESVLLDAAPAAAFSDVANLCFRELYVVLFRAELLVSYVASAGRAWALLRGPHRRLLSGPRRRACSATRRTNGDGPEGSCSQDRTRQPRAHTKTGARSGKLRISTNSPEEEDGCTFMSCNRNV